MNEAKSKIKQLVEKYETVLDSDQVSKYSEEETKKGFIEPLFIALGWEVSNKNEVTAEESQLQGRVDYGFYVDGRIRFYLEAKPLKADLHNDEYAKQAIRYSWNKGVDWAVLTDFESLKVFYCQDPTQSLFSKLVFEIPFNEYLERFNQLWLLSRQSFQEKGLDTYARDHGKMMQKISVGDQLYKHLNESREILIAKLGVWNGIKDQNLLEEGVQKLLDRLVFIRVAEDRGIEPPTLIPLVRAWENDKKGKTLYESMVTKFRELDSIYNSNLFTEHPFEKWNESPGVTEDVINILQGKTGYYEYDFKVMPADVLGTVYENYLGYKLAESQKGVVLDKSAKKRKEQGIYYTPEYIVDYIVRSTLKPVLDRCKTIGDLQKIRVLDPACGSGSFLIKALEVINEKYKEFGNKGNEYTKIMILQQNIYGVDLDEQAVEIARLNLLLNTLETRMPLPKLDKNIKNGNSLISGSDEELKKYFGENYRDKKPFNWEEEFLEVFKQGGFDVIIGNPPYIRPEKFEKSDRNYYINSGHFDKFFGRFDIYILFLELAAKILKRNGSFSFIIPSSFFNQNYAKIIRNWFLTDFMILNIEDLSDVKVFGDASVQSAIIIIQKNLPNKEQKILVRKTEDLGMFNSKSNKALINQSSFLKNSNYMIRTNIGSDSQTIEKIKSNSINLNKICYVVIGAVPHDSKTGASKDRLISSNKERDTQVKYIEGKDVGRYKLEWRGIYLDYQPSEMHRPKFPQLFENEKLIIRNISTKEGLLAVIDEGFYYTNDTVSLCVPWHYLEGVKMRGVQGSSDQKDNSKKYSLFYLLGLINSKLLNFYFKKVLSSNLHVYPEAIRNLPIHKIDFKNHLNNNLERSIALLSEKMCNLKNLLKTLEENSDKWNSIKSEIEKVDKKIDEEVYKLYGLTAEEIATVEGRGVKMTSR